MVEEEEEEEREEEEEEEGEGIGCVTSPVLTAVPPCFSCCGGSVFLREPRVHSTLFVSPERR